MHVSPDALMQKTAAALPMDPGPAGSSVQYAPSVRALLSLLLLALGMGDAFAASATAKQRSLDEWRALTSPSAPAPRVFVKGDNIRFYFQDQTNVVGFRADWSRLRVPTAGYKINSALLRLDARPPRIPEDARRWHEATVIANREW
jgi:hypothetical protein